MNPQPTPPAHNNPSDQLKATSKRNNSPSPFGEGVRGVRNDRLLQDIINYLRLHHALDAAFLLSKTTHTTQKQSYAPPNHTPLQRTFTYTLLIITKSSRSIAGPREPISNSNVAGPREPISKSNVAGPREPISKSTPPLLGRGGRGVRTPLNPADLSDLLHNHTQKQAQVHIIPFTAKAVKEKGQANHNFLSKALTHARCIYKENPQQEAATRPSTTNHPSIKEAIHREWDTRLKRAEFLYENVSTLHTTNEPVVCFELLHSMLTQTCLGLIYVFLEYKPSYTALPYLLHLCTLFTDLPEKVFPKNNYRNHHIYHHLCIARTMMVHKTKHSLTLKDADKAWKKCGIFLSEAETLVENHFASLPISGH